jgi:hypothetical protein
MTFEIEDVQDTYVLYVAAGEISSGYKVNVQVAMYHRERKAMITTDLQNSGGYDVWYSNETSMVWAEALRMLGITESDLEELHDDRQATIAQEEMDELRGYEIERVGYV